MKKDIYKIWCNRNQLFADIPKDLLFSSSLHVNDNVTTDKIRIGQLLWRKYAVAQINAAVKQKKLPPISSQKCAECGEWASDYHHSSYWPEHVLNVIPLCRYCHRAV